MSTPDVEVILMRQLSGYLGLPILIVGPNGDLVYFNEAAEPILGKRFDETGPIRLKEFMEMFKPVNEKGQPLSRAEQPLFHATMERRPSHQRSWIQGLDGVRRHIEGIAFPLLGQDGRLMGAAGIFWEIDRKQ
jgi:PAS domain-containing protein